MELFTEIAVKYHVEYHVDIVVDDFLFTTTIQCISLRGVEVELWTVKLASGVQYPAKASGFNKQN